MTTVEDWLTQYVTRHGGVVGTVHLVSRDEPDALELVADVNLPPPVREVTRRIPRGKGMAGLAWERAAPVQACNLKTDASGDVRPGARQVGAQGAVALPVRAGSGAIVGVVGIAWADERVLDDDEVARLTEDAERGPFAAG